MNRSATTSVEPTDARSESSNGSTVAPPSVDPIGRRSAGRLPPVDDTIAAIASAPGVGAVGVVRLSGPDAYSIADALFTARRGPPPSKRAAGRVVYGDVVDGQRVVDEALLLTFRAPRSYTAQDVVELQTHGGPAVLRATLDLCLKHGARLAGPGEFTLRAYLNERLDLLQAESVLELVNAQTDGARRNAALGLGGALGRRLDQVQSAITTAYAAVQAAFDYPDEGVPEAQLGVPLREALADVRSLLSTAAAGRLSRHGARLALLGQPNAGKSSLLNALLGYQRSIVSDVPGTTRDYLEAPLVLAGIPLTAVDTAGIREAGDAIEASGVEQARQIAANADLRLVLVDAAEPLSSDGRALLAQMPAERTIFVLTKSDRPAVVTAANLGAPAGAEVVAVSALTGAGLEELKEAVAAALLGDAAGTELWLTQERHVAALEAVERHLVAALGQADTEELDLASLELQDALGALSDVTGRHGIAEEALASIFANFCVGK